MDGKTLPGGLGRLDPARFHGWGPAPIPDPRDAAVTEVVDALVAAGPAAVSRACRNLDEPRANVLRAYAERMSDLAVRTGDRQALFRSLVALVVGGLHAGRREALRVMALLDDAAGRIQVDLVALVSEVVEVVGDDAAGQLALWLRRPQQLRHPEAMGFVGHWGPDGFRYVEHLPEWEAREDS